MAVAQEAASRAAAQTLFDEARKLTAAGSYTEACPKFEESQKLDPGFGTAFYLADCWQHIGRTASAWALYHEVADGTKAAGQVDRSAVAKARATVLEGSLSKLSIAVAEPVPDLRVERNGTVVGKALWGSSVPVDPGEHKIVATAPGRKRWEKTILVRPDGGHEALTIPALEVEVVEQKPETPSLTPSSGESGADTGVDGKRSLTHEGQLGAILRLDGAGIVFAKSDGAGGTIGPSPAVGVTYGVAPFLDVGASALLGDSKGFAPHATAFLLTGQVKPLVTVAVPVMFVEGARGGVRGSAGVEWDPDRRFGAFLDIGAAYFFSMPSGYDKFVLVPSVGVQARL